MFLTNGYCNPLKLCHFAQKEKLIVCKMPKIIAQILSLLFLRYINGIIMYTNTWLLPQIYYKGECI